MTPNASNVLTILRRIGAIPYTVLAGKSNTKKVARFTLPNGNPVVLEIDRKTPNIWLRPEHERGMLGAIGKAEHYPPGRGRHSNLGQVREFIESALVKVSITSMNWSDIECAIGSIARK
jgi:hypothetical protein